MTELKSPKLDDESISDIVEFLHALSSDKLVRRIAVRDRQIAPGREALAVSLEDR
jgi:hypothetical protein